MKRISILLLSVIMVSGCVSNGNNTTYTTKKTQETNIKNNSSELGQLNDIIQLEEKTANNFQKKMLNAIKIQLTKASQSSGLIQEIAIEDAINRLKNYPYPSKELQTFLVGK